MKSIFHSAGLLVLFMTMCFAVDDGVKTFQGEIADTQCSMNVHSLTRSHQEMLKSKSIGGNSASCTLYCIKYLGGDFVLSTKDEVYRLNGHAEEVRNLAGLEVRITGTVDKKSKTIHIAKIEPADRKGL